MPADEQPTYRVRTPEELDAFSATLTERKFLAILGIELPEGVGDTPLTNEADSFMSAEAAQASPGRYRWRQLPDEDAEGALFMVVDSEDETAEYSSFQAIAYEEFGLVDVAAFSYESEAGPAGVERVLGLLRADPRMAEDPTL